MMKRVRARRWVFTINNFTYEEEEAVRNLEINEDVEAVIAEEEHLEEGTPHIQGYLRTIRQIDRSVVLRWLGRRAHIEVAMGSEVDNIKYCTKEDQVIVEKLNDIRLVRSEICVLHTSSRRVVFNHILDFSPIHQGGFSYLTHISTSYSCITTNVLSSKEPRS